MKRGTNAELQSRGTYVKNRDSDHFLSKNRSCLIKKWSLSLFLDVSSYLYAVPFSFSTYCCAENAA